MTRTRASARALRLIEIGESLEASAQSTAELARRFRVGKRTIHRDLQGLAQLGYEVERRGRRYVATKGTNTLNAVEALAVHSATRLLVHHTRINDRHYRSALTKLAASLPQPAREYLRRSVDGIGSLSSEGSRTLEMVARAWFEERVLRFDYRAPIGSGKPHRNDLEVYFFEISPVSLVPYVIGYERSFFGKILTFRLDRMSHPRVLDEAYVVPDDFDPVEHLAGAWGIVTGPKVEVRARVRAAVADRVHDGVHRNLTIDGTAENGDLLVTVVAGTDKNGIPIDLLPWLLSWGSALEVVAPEHLRQYLRHEHRAALEAYAEAEDT